MIKRYADKQIAEIWSDENKLLLWQKVELAVIRAREKQAEFPAGVHEKISQILKNNPIDTVWWEERDEQIRHDLNAFLDERLRFLPQELHQYFDTSLLQCRLECA